MFKKFAKKIINNLGYDFVRIESNLNFSEIVQFPPDFEEESQSIIRLVKEQTLTSVERLNSLIGATKYIIKNNIPGSIVECGVWRGGSMMSVAHTLQAFSSNERELYLFDTYEGMTSPTEKDVTHFDVNASILLNSQNQKEREDYFCYASLEDVQSNLFSTMYPKEKIHFIKGRVEDTIPEFAPDKIALLRLDTDWYESTRHELEHLFPRIVSGGVIIIDDYGYWKGCKEATDEYIDKNKIPILLNRIDLTGRIAIKWQP